VHGAKARGTTASTRGVMVLEVDRANFFGYPRSKNTNKKWIISFFNVSFNIWTSYDEVYTVVLGLSLTAVEKDPRLSSGLGPYILC
jgi:hypothetical protein